MASFKDGSGASWTVKLNVGLVDEIKEQSGIDLDMILESPDEMGKLFQKSPRKLVELLWVVCEEQASSRGVDPKNFGRLFDRETLDRATDALLEAIVDFYPRASAGNALKAKLPQILANMDKRISEDANSRLEKLLSSTDTN